MTTASKIMDKLISGTIEKIKQDKVAPEPGWKFFLKHLAAWAGFAFLALLGALSLAMIMTVLLGMDWGALGLLKIRFMPFLIRTLPFAWIIFLVVFLILAFLGLRSTRFGYRYSASKIILIIILVILIVAPLSYWLGADRPMMGLARRIMPLAAEELGVKQKVWYQPEEGLLSGAVTRVEPARKAFFIEGPDKEIWEVSSEKQPLIRGGAVPEPGRIVKIIGRKTGEGKFEASEIRPWENMFERMRLRHMGNGGMGPGRERGNGPGFMMGPGGMMGQ